MGYFITFLGLSMDTLFPDHESQLTRLNRIEGQIKGIRRMVEDRRYCVDILSQIRAVTGALRQIELGVLERHIRHCVTQAARSEDENELKEKTEEILKLMASL